jgi:hypothetical protein
LREELRHAMRLTPSLLLLEELHSLAMRLAVPAFLDSLPAALEGDAPLRGSDGALGQVREALQLVKEKQHEEPLSSWAQRGELALRLLEAFEAPSALAKAEIDSLSTALAAVTKKPSLWAPRAASVYACLSIIRQRLDAKHGGPSSAKLPVVALPEAGDFFRGSLQPALFQALFPASS